MCQRFNTDENKFGFFHIWNQKDDPDEDDIIKTANKKQSKIRNLTEILNDDFKFKYLIEKENIDETDDEDKIKLNKNISDNVNKIMNEVGKIVSKIKVSQDNLSKTNMNSLINTKKRAIKPEQEENEYKNLIIKKKEREYQKLLPSKPSKKKSSHYRFLSDFYRQQINKMLINYNPGKFASNKKINRKENPEINKEIEKKAKLIKEEFFHITSPNFFRKNSKSFKNTFYKNKNNNKLNIDTNTNINFYQKKNGKSPRNEDISLPKIPNYTTMNFHPLTKNKNITNSQKRLNLYNFGRCL